MILETARKNGILINNGDVLHENGRKCNKIW